jgi:hypothetical protein
MRGHPSLLQERAVESQQMIEGDRLARGNAVNRRGHSPDIAEHLDGSNVSRLLALIPCGLGPQQPPGADLEPLNA